MSLNTFNQNKIVSQLADITNSGQIKGFKKVTQAEYDTLPVSKNTDGIVYLISG